MLSFFRRKLIPSMFRTSKWQACGKPGREAGQRWTYLSLEALEERVAPANTINIVGGGAIGTAVALIQAQNAGDFLFTNTGTFNIDPNAFVGAGAISLRANNDVTITNAIDANHPGDSLTILAGGSINVDANVTYVNALNFTANSQLAAIGAQTAEIAVFAMSSGATINAGTAAINITLDSGTGINTSNNILLGNLTTTGSVSVANEGPSLGGSVGEITAANSINSPNVSLDAVNGSIGLFASPINLTAANVNVNDRGTFGVFLAGAGNLALGTISNSSGAINITAVGSITVNGPVTDSDTSSNGVVTLNSAFSGTTAAALNVSGMVKAQVQNYIAGDGSTGTSNVSFTGALLEGPGGITTPTFFSYQQDASIADANVPTAAQFGNGVPLTYVIASLQGSVTVSTFTNVAGSNLILYSIAGGVTLGSGGNTALTLASLSANVTSGNTITINSTAATTITTTSTVGSTTNGMVFNGAVSLSQNTTLVANGGGVDFASNSANNLGNVNSLTVTAGGAFTLGGGGFVLLQNLTVTGAAINLNGSVLAIGDQTYNSPVLLGTNVSLGDVTTTFLGSIDSAAGATNFDLSINSTTATNFDGAGGIGQNKALNTLTTSNGAVDFSGTTIVDTVYTQSYAGAVTLDNDLALSSTTGGVTFGSTVNGGFSLTVAASSGAVTYSNSVGGGSSLSQLVVTGSTITIHGGATTVGDQIYNGAISVGVNTTFNTNKGAVLNFNGTINGFQTGSQSIIIGNVNTAGEVIFGGSIGSNIALGFVTVSATQILINGTSVVTTGGQTYIGDVFLAAAPTVTLNASSAGANVIFYGDLTLGPSATAAMDTVIVTGIFTLSANSTLYSTLNTLSTAAYGNVNAITSNLTDANLSLTFLGTPTVGNNYTIATNVAGSTFANVTTDGSSKFYVSGEDFTAVNTLGLTLTAVNPTDAPLTVGSGGTYSTIQAAIDASVSGDVIEIDNSLNNYAGFTTNNGTNNVSLLFDFISGGTVTINSAVTLTADTAFELSGTGLTFQGSNAQIDGDFNLIVFANSTANLDLQGNVGRLTPLNSFTTVGANLTTQLAANITTNTTSGSQTFFGNVQLQTSLPGNLATLTAKMATFNGTVGDGVAGGGEDTLSVVGNAVFSGAIGSPLGALTVSGQTYLNNGGVKTGTTNGGTGTQSYTGAVILGTASTTLSGLTLSANALGFAGAGNNTNSLTLTFTGGITLGGGELSDVNNLSVSDTVNLTGDIVTGGTQTYNTGAGGVTLTGNTTLTASGVTFMHTVDGMTAASKALYINGPATFDASVGGFTTLQSLTVTQTTSLDTANGSITIDTTAGQIYLQTVTITTSGSGQSVTFTDNGANNIKFGQSISGDVNDPDIFFTGNDNQVVFNGAIGGGIGLFQLDGMATVVFQNGATGVTSVSDQCYTGPIDLVNISGGLFTASSSAGDVMLGVVVGGGNSLTVSGTTDNELGGDITGVDNLIVNTGPIFLNTANPLTITTNGTQKYATDVALVTTADLTGALVTFGSTVEDRNIAGTDGLTINGNAVFKASVGAGGQSLNSFSVSGTASVNPTAPIAIGFNVTTSESFGSTLTLGANVNGFTVGAPAGATFGGPIVANGTDFITSAAATFNGVVNGVGAFDITGIANINCGIVNSTGTQTYNFVTLGQSSGTVTVLTATGSASSIVFVGGVSVSGTSTSLSAFADDNVSFASSVTLGTPGTLNAVADMTGLNAAGSGNGQITIAGAIQANGGNVSLAGSAFNSSLYTINAGAGNIILAPSVVATVGVGAGAQNFQISNGQLGLLGCTNLTIGGVDASSVTVNGADTTASAIEDTAFLISTPLAGAGLITFTSASTFNNPPKNNLGLVVGTNGAIVNGTQTLPGAPNITSNSLTLAAGTGIGVVVDGGIGALLVQTGTLNANVTGTGSINVTNVAAGGNLAVTSSTTTNGAINLTALGGDLTTTATTGTDIDAPGNTVTINVSGNVVSGTATGVTDVGAASLAINGTGSTSGFGTSTNPLKTALGTFAANVGTGGVFLSNTGNLTIGTVNPLNGITATGGNLTLTASGNLTISEPMSTATSGGSAGAISLTGGTDITGNTITIIANLTATSAFVTDSTGTDTFIITPSTGTVITATGGRPAIDTIEYNNPGALALTGSSAGKFSGLNVADVVFSGFSRTSLGSSLANLGAADAFGSLDTVDRATAFSGLTADEAYIQELYLDDLGRAGSKSELDGWVSVLDGAGGTRSLVAQDIAGSMEGRDHLVRSWYIAFLGRRANGTEELGWVNALASQNEEQVLSQILSSQEFYNRAQTLGFGDTADGNFVRALYKLLLNRTASSGEVAGWVGQIPAVGQQGVALGFLISTEFRTNDFEGYYEGLLQRSSDAAGISGWVNSSLNLISVFVSFEGSDEFYKNG